jgi:hypothetical protein
MSTHSTKEPKNLMDGLFHEMNRVREIIKEYEHPMLKGAVFIASSMMKIDIQRAEKSIRDNDVIEMMVCYTKLKEYEL